MMSLHIVAFITQVSINDCLVKLAMKIWQFLNVPLYKYVE
jgi:hypothetical protein